MSDKKNVNEELVESAIQLINEKGKKNEKGDVLTLNASDYSDYVAKQGIPKPVQQKIGEIEAAKKTADIRVATSMLVEQIDHAKKDGQDPNTCTATVKTMLPQGKDEVTITGKRVFPNPQEPGSHSERYGFVRLSAKRDRTMDSSELTKTADLIEKTIMK